jgi:predicted dehydrogenase
MADKIRVGIVGANPEGNSWGARAHIPALKSLPDYELKAICTAHEDTARRAAENFGAELAYHDYNRMFENPDIDLVSVAVRVPYHHEITMAALRAGKNVYCEWPLGANRAEAEEMADLARAKGVKTMTGLQGRSDPALTYMRELIAEGYIGEVVACHMLQLSGGSLERQTGRVWAIDKSKGANTMTIQGGHSIDALCFGVGEFAEVSAKVATQVKQVRISDTGETMTTDSPDNVLVSGVLENGALASVHVGSVPFHGTGGWRLEIYGKEGTIIASAGQPNLGPTRLMGSKGREQLAEMTVPDRFVLVPEGTPQGQPYNVAHAYTRFADGLRDGQATDPDFELALRRHKLLEAMERASDEGRTVRLD